MAKVKAVFFVPINDNDGRSLQAEIDDLEAELYLHFVGWTSLGFVRGAYCMADGSQCMDDSRAYMVILDESRTDELKQVLGDFRAKTKQESIYLEIQRGVEIHFVN